MSYPVRWAGKPDDVPLWDASRGFSLTAAAECAAVREGISPFSVEHLRRMADNDYELYSLPERTEPWNPSPAPTEGYPRLVRSNCERIVLGTYRHDEDVLGELAPFGRDKYLDPWRAGKPATVLQRKIMEFAEKYGAPYRREENTLFAWLALLVHIDIHHTAVRALGKDVHGYEVMLSALDFRYEGVKDRIARKASKSLRGFADSSLFLPSIEPFQTGEGYRTDWEQLDPWHEEIFQDVEAIFGSYEDEYFAPDLDELELMQLGFLIDTALKIEAAEDLHISQEEEVEKVVYDEAERKKTLSRKVAKELRRKIADGLLASFSERIQDTRDLDHQLAMTSDGLVLKCPVGVWVDFKLAQLWRNNIPLQECEQCGAIFAPLHKGGKYCKGGGCRDKSYRERKTKAKQGHVDV